MAKIVTLKRQDGEIIFPVTSTKSVLDSEGVSMEKIFSKKSETIEDVSFRYEKGEVVLEAEFADGDTSISSIPEATVTANGLMSANDKLAIDSLRAPIIELAGKNVVEIQGMIDSWLEKNYSTYGACFKANIDYNGLYNAWNSDKESDRNKTISTGSFATFTVSHVNAPGYTQLTITSQSNKAIFIVAKSSTWSKITKIAFADTAVSDVNIISSPTDGVRIEVKMGDGTYKTPISIPEASYNYTLDTPANGLMSGLDKKAIDLALRAEHNNLAGKTIKDLQDALSEWLTRITSDSISSAKFITNVGLNFINDWNSGNTSGVMAVSGRSTFTLAAGYINNQYALLKVEMYYNASTTRKPLVYYVSIYNGVWGKFYQVATLNNTVAGLNIADEAQTGNVYLELEMGDGVSKIAGYLPTASTSGHGLMDREDKAKLDSIDKIPDNFIEGLFSASAGSDQNRVVV